MRITLLLFCTILLQRLPGQEPTTARLGKEIQLDFASIASSAARATEKSSVTINLPMPSGASEYVEIFDQNSNRNVISDVKIYTGISMKSRSAIKLTLTPSGLYVAIHYKGGYYFIDPVGASKTRYIFRSLNEVPMGRCSSGHSLLDIKTEVDKLSRSIAPFPVGSELRRFRMAAAATNELTGTLGQIAARDQIVAVISAANLIFEAEASIRFELISKTTDLTLIFDSITDPFDPGEFADADKAQEGFNTLNNDNLLLYNEYDVGHTFGLEAGDCCSVGGKAGPEPCIDASKARGWTQFTAGASTAFIVGTFIHEIGHQFNADHTYNAIGGNPDDAPPPSFCIDGWSNNSAVEPGSGSTLMAYGTNCTSPVNYVLNAPIDESYFHTISLEQIYLAVNSFSCVTSQTTGNNPPVANASDDLTIPIGTPFSLTGSAMDADGNNGLTFVWDQMDVATTQDQGALGSLIAGSGGYTAVNSTSNAPLFRSRMSNSPTRIFPGLSYILDGTNNPPDNVGEDLPRQGRNMTFRFTVRDNAVNGGGLDSDVMEVTVDGSVDPLVLTSQNSSQMMVGGMSYMVTWSGTNTSTISPNLKILLSTDGGQTFPSVLLASTPANTGSAMVIIPYNVVASSQARIKLSSTHHPTAEYFDINDVDLTTEPGTGCAEDLIVDAMIVAGNSLASKSITTSGNVTVNGAAVFAAQTISINQGFEVPAGNCFEANNDGCSYNRILNCDNGSPSQDGTCNAPFILTCGQLFNGMNPMGVSELGTSEYGYPENVHMIEVPANSSVNITLDNLTSDLDLFTGVSCTDNVFNQNTTEGGVTAETRTLSNNTGSPMIFYVVVERYNDASSNYTLACEMIPGISTY